LIPLLLLLPTFRLITMEYIIFYSIKKSCFTSSDFRSCLLSNYNYTHLIIIVVIIIIVNAPPLWAGGKLFPLQHINNFAFYHVPFELFFAAANFSYLLACRVSFSFSFSSCSTQIYINFQQKPSHHSYTLDFADDNTCCCWLLVE